MAMRPVFIPLLNDGRFVAERMVEFKWHSGLSISQKQKTIRELHAMAINDWGVSNPVEVSSKSDFSEA